MQPPPRNACCDQETAMDLVWRDSVLDCGSPLPLSGCRPAIKSARGLAQSKTWRQFGRFVRLEYRCRIQGFPRGRRKSAVAWRANDCSRITVISSCPALDFSPVRNVFRRPVVMPFRPAGAHLHRQTHVAPVRRASPAPAPVFVATRSCLIEPVHSVPADAADDTLRPSSHR